MQRSLNRYVLLDQGLAVIVSNVVIAAGITWGFYRQATVVPVEGSAGVLADAAITSMILPFLVCLIVSQITRADMRRGRVSPRITPSGTGRTSTGWGTLVLRCVMFSVAACCLAWPLLAVILGMSGMHEMTLFSFLALKSLYAGILAGLVGPLSAWLVLGEEVPSREVHAAAVGSLAERASHS